MWGRSRVKLPFGGGVKTPVRLDQHPKPRDKTRKSRDVPQKKSSSTSIIYWRSLSSAVAFAGLLASIIAETKASRVFTTGNAFCLGRNYYDPHREIRILLRL
jgi:hypothetical protein